MKKETNFFLCVWLSNLIAPLAFIFFDQYVTWDSSAVEARIYCVRIIKDAPIFLMGLFGAVIPIIYVRYNVSGFLVSAIDRLEASLRKKTVLRARISRLEASGIMAVYVLVCGIVFVAPVDLESRLRVDLQAILVVQGLVVFFSSFWLIGFYNALIGRKFAIGYRRKIKFGLNRNSTSGE